MIRERDLDRHTIRKGKKQDTDEKPTRGLRVKRRVVRKEVGIRLATVKQTAGEWRRWLTYQARQKSKQILTDHIHSLGS
jgi:hypothetical protein